MKKYLTVGAVLALAAAVMVFGSLIGSLTTPSEPLLDDAASAGSAGGNGAGPGAPKPPPLYFYAFVGPGTQLSVVGAEIEMAASSGIHQHILRLPLPWNGDFTGLDAALAAAATADTSSTIYLDLNVNPPLTWFADHAAETSPVRTRGDAHPSIGSVAWIDAVKDRLSLLADHLVATEAGTRVAGVVLSALENGRWYRSDGYDSSEANTQTFRAWLASRYDTDAALQTAWGDDVVSLVSAPVPARPKRSAGEGTFAQLPDSQDRVDYLMYVNARTAAVVRELAAHMKASMSADFLVYASYGQQLELSAADSGQFALGELLRSDVDGFLCPVSYVNRGLMGVGGITGPAHSALLHDKAWIVLDDTRTGNRVAEGDAELRRSAGMRSDDLLNILRRNFGYAAMNGLGLAWADPAGSGNFYDRELWNELKSIVPLYATVGNSRAAWPTAPPTLLVVIDEGSRAYQRSINALDRQLYFDIRDDALRSAISTKFVLLDDVISGKAPPASVYLFLNAFQLTEDTRTRLHYMLTESKAAAIWLYAPGYIDETASLSNVAATTRMTVKSFSGATASGSTYKFNGSWLGETSSIGGDGDWDPLFYVEDEDADELAYFTASGRASVAVKFLAEGWTSVFVCEPVLPLELLREIVDILELPIKVKRKGAVLPDFAHVNDEFFLLHSTGQGVRLLDLGGRYNVTDLYDPEIGWHRKRLISLTMRPGETRFFRLEPIAGEVTDEDRELEPVPDASESGE